MGYRFNMTTPQLKHFLIIYDAPNGELLSITEFEDELLAVDALTKMERKHLRDAKMRIVLLSGPSREAIEQTHGNFFEQPERTVA